MIREKIPSYHPSRCKAELSRTIWRDLARFGVMLTNCSTYVSDASRHGNRNRGFITARCDERITKSNEIAEPTIMRVGKPKRQRSRLPYRYVYSITRWKHRIGDAGYNTHVAFARYNFFFRYRATQRVIMNRNLSSLLMLYTLSIYT